MSIAIGHCRYKSAVESYVFLDSCTVFFNNRYLSILGASQEDFVSGYSGRGFNQILLLPLVAKTGTDKFFYIRCLH